MFAIFLVNLYSLPHKRDHTVIALLQSPTPVFSIHPQPSILPRYFFVDNIRLIRRRSHSLHGVCYLRYLTLGPYRYVRKLEQLILLKQNEGAHSFFGLSARRRKQSIRLAPIERPAHSL